MRAFVRWCLPLALLLLGIARPAHAQTGTVTGVVTAADSDQPLPAALVELRSGERVLSSTLTNQDGRFRFTNIPAGSYTVLVSAVGYGEQRRENVSLAAGAVATVDLSLDQVAFDLQPVVVSASRRAERSEEAPATVAVVNEREIDERPALTPMEHLRSAPGVDIITYGLQGSNIVTRGFNNIFSGSLHMLTDYRLAHVPSLKVNLVHFVPASSEDLERMEVVLGPASALYGPNTANGVVHLLTKSPLTDQSTSVAVTGGERSVFEGAFRTAQLLSPNFGLKVSGRYLQGDEWEYIDPTEVAARDAAFADTARFIALEMQGGVSREEASRRLHRIAQRDFDHQQWSLEARGDWRVTEDLTAVFSAGRSTIANAIELTGLGAAVADDWAYSYYQARANAGRFFAQVYLNASDAGDSFTLQDGETIVDKSKLFVAQVQHGTQIGLRHDLTYGVDVLLTMPESDSTIYGQFDEDDNFSEIGAYVQSESALSPKLDLVLAARVDKHSELDDPMFSPRAGIVFKPAQGHNFRLTYNRAFSNPTALNLFLDKSGGIARAPLGQLGYRERGQGTGRDGYHFQNADGSLVGMRSPFNPNPKQILPAQSLIGFWPAAVEVFRQQALAAGENPQQVEMLRQGLLAVQPQTDVIGMSVINPLTRVATPLEDAIIPDVARISESLSSDVEFGYNGLIGDRLLIAGDVWYSKKRDFVSPLIPVTPLLAYNGPNLGAYLGGTLGAALVQMGMSPQEAQAIVQEVTIGMAQIPLAVVSSEDVNAVGADVMATYLNFGDVDLWGADLSATLLLTDKWSLGATAGWVDKNHLRMSIRDVPEDCEGTITGNCQVVALNAPDKKGSLSLTYRDLVSGFNGEVRARYQAEFPANSADFVGLECIGSEFAGTGECVDAFTLVDLTLGYRLPMAPGASIQLAVSNVFDEGYRSFLGVPEIGRMALLRLRYEF